MIVQFLGAHNLESRSTGFTCVLVDDILAIDAGALTRSLTFSAQREIRALLLTHRHYDHIRDIPALAMNFYLSGRSISLYCTAETAGDLGAYLCDGRLYPDFRARPEEDPALRIVTVEPYRTEQVAGYAVMAVPVKHSVPAAGFQVTSPQGESLFYAGDTGPGLGECWQHVSPQLLAIEVTLPDEQEDSARLAGHMTPSLLHQEMLGFFKVKSYLPRIIAMHMNPEMEDDIRHQLQRVSEALQCPIALAHEGMGVRL